MNSIKEDEDIIILKKLIQNERLIISQNRMTEIV